MTPAHRALSSENESGDKPLYVLYPIQRHDLDDLPPFRLGVREHVPVEDKVSLLPYFGEQPTRVL